MLRKGADIELLKLKMEFINSKRNRELDWFLRLQERKLEEVSETLRQVGERNNGLR
ncbi:hypothetical protein P5609_001370 [Bacillus licheniformis]|uniref:hypothetical protein n=1 Tax=Bacillus licheniformis TaxID=1402 RepID=UPI00018C8054|nr:hypothetical protein [Bacillus licheniformis]MDH3162339.1 hypothetical protein [Bacillus licheniformis]MED4409025.1 hypothetical protein [Bacillus licheniformis]